MYAGTSTVGPLATAGAPSAPHATTTASAAITGRPRRPNRFIPTPRRPIRGSTFRPRPFGRPTARRNGTGSVRAPSGEVPRPECRRRAEKQRSRDRREEQTRAGDRTAGDVAAAPSRDEDDRIAEEQ